MARFARSSLLASLCALVCALLVAVPASAHGGEAVPLADQYVGGVNVEVHGDRIPAGTDAYLRQATARRAIARVAALDPAAPQLASTWCGQQRSVDDTIDSATGSGPAIKVIYARPNDVADQFAARDDLIQQDARDISQSFALAANGTKTVRFDVGTDCGPLYIDIMSVTLPRAKAAYTGVGLQARVNLLQGDLRPLVAGVGGTHDFLVYAEGLYAGDGVSGVATLYDDDSRGAGNASNRGGQFAFVLGFGVGNRRTTAQHELGHNLGAVQYSAPHSTGAGHCFENYDVMCYADGGTKGHTADMTYPAGCTSQSQPAWDCSADDYFSPLPAPGSYLASHWNLYDSVYLCAPADCIVGAAGATSSAPPLPSPQTGGGGGGGSGSGGAGGGGGGSGGGGSGGSGSSGTTTSPPPTPPSDPGPPQVILPAQTATAAPTAAQLVRAALDEAESSFSRALVAAGGVGALRSGRPVRVRVSSPSSGIVVARLTLRGRTLARATLAVRAGVPATVTLRPDARARRSLRTARASALALRLSLRAS